MTNNEQRAPFDLAAVSSGIAGTGFAGHLHHVSSVSSTQTLALAAAAAGARQGVWIADEQTAGRGRGDHVWHSAPNGGVYLSALVAPSIPMTGAMQLSLRSAVAGQAAIAETTGFRMPQEIDIRWPNDLILCGRKVGGILIETAAVPATAERRSLLRYAVIGVGINCNQMRFAPELEPVATSLRRELPRDSPALSREPLVIALLRHLDHQVEQLARGTGGNRAVPAGDLGRHSTWFSGRHVSVSEDGGYTGTTAGLTSDGFLRIRLADGTVRTVRSGGVREAATSN